MEQLFDWDKPQRQPLAGLVIVFIKTFWEILKRVWPFVLLFFFNDKPGKVDRYEIIAIGIASLTIFSSIIRFVFFRFFIRDEELIVKRGWLKKETIIVPLQKIQTVHIEESFVHKALGIVKISIDTAGSAKTEVKIDALTRPMAEALQLKLHAKGENQNGEERKEKEVVLPIVQLSLNDLLKLSLSANHIEAFFILLTFVVGLYDNLRSINEGLITTATGLLPKSSLLIFSFLFAVIIVITVAISTLRICLKFYGLSVTRMPAGFYIKAGLFNVRERIVSFQKIQAVTWRANWLRKQFGVWLLEYKIAGADDLKKAQRVEVPITQQKYIAPLIDQYHSLPGNEAMTAVHIHPSYAWRRLLFFGIAAAILIIAAWNWWGLKSFGFLLLPLLVALKSFLLQKRFRLYAFNEVLYINKSTYGTENTLLKWYKLQSVTLQQSLYQRSNNLATVKLHTASGNFILPYISLIAARQIINYGLFKIETSEDPWM